MTRTLAAILSSLVLSLGCASAAHAQPDAAAGQVQAQTGTTPAQANAAPEQVNVVHAKAELNEGARAYKDGRFADAEQHFRRALELDPAQKNAPLFIARAVQQQYKPGDPSPENVATGERAVAAYQDILNSDPQIEDAFKAIVFLYGQMKRDDKVDEMLTQRANDPSVPDEKRAEVLVVLASKQLKCSYDITERRENRKRDTKSGRVTYRMPADAETFQKARQCADEGLRLVEQAVSLDPNSPSAWSYKANLLREASKIAEMEGAAEQKEEFERQSAEAFDAQKRAGAEAERRQQQQQQQQQQQRQQKEPPRDTPQELPQEPVPAPPAL